MAYPEPSYFGACPPPPLFGTDCRLLLKVSVIEVDLVATLLGKWRGSVPELNLRHGLLIGFDAVANFMSHDKRNFTCGSGDC